MTKWSPPSHFPAGDGRGNGEPSAAGSSDKANWITQMQNDVPTIFPNIKAVAYYNTNLVPGGTCIRR